MKRDNVIADKSMEFAVQIVKLSKWLREEKRESVISNQLLKSGTSIGANVREAIQGQSKRGLYGKDADSAKRSKRERILVGAYGESGNNE